MGSTCLQLSNSPTPNLYQNTKFASLVIYVLDFDRFSLFPLYLKPTDFPQTLMIDLILTDDGFSSNFNERFNGTVAQWLST